MEFGGEMNNPAVGGDAHIAPRENVPITTCFRRNHTMYNGPMWASAPTARSAKFQFICPPLQFEPVYGILKKILFRKHPAVCLWEPVEEY